MRGRSSTLSLRVRVAVNINGKEYVLRAGDSIYFNPSFPHGQRAIGTVSKFLTVINENQKNRK